MQSSKDKSLSSSAHPRSLEWLRLISAFLILTYGVRKLIGTGQFGLAHTLGSRPISTLSGFELTWFYYEYSHAYGIILGLTQVSGGTLLLFRRSALLGAAVLTPVMANILLINIFFHIAVGAEIVAAFVFVTCLLLLWQERLAFFEIFWPTQYKDLPLGGSAEKAAVVIVVLLVIVEAVIFAKFAAH
jgi:hypothetical protein